MDHDCLQGHVYREGYMAGEMTSFLRNGHPRYESEQNPSKLKKSKISVPEAPKFEIF